MRTALVLTLLAVLAVLAACSEAPSTTAVGVAPAPAPATQTLASSSETHESGRDIYNFRCYFCHGYSGDAQTLASTYLTPPPRDFKATSIDQLSRERMLAVVTHGSGDTAMRGFEGILLPSEIAAVTDFVRNEFMVSKALNTRYHTKANGWPDHQRYAAAFPFATGQMAIDHPTEQMTPEQRAGRSLYMASCISCHDRSKVNVAGAPWELRPLSYPRNGFSPGDNYASPGLPSPGDGANVDAITSATPYALHDVVPRLAGLSKQEQRGETLYQQNCAFCHAADGTGRNWIGSFLEPHPRDLTEAAFMVNMTRERLAAVIRDGIPQTSMPAWRSVLTESDIQSVMAYISRAFHPLPPSQSATRAKTAPGQ